MRRRYHRRTFTLGRRGCSNLFPSQVMHWMVSNHRILKIYLVMIEDRRIRDNQADYWPKVATIAFIWDIWLLFELFWIIVKIVIGYARGHTFSIQKVNISALSVAEMALTFSEYSDSDFLQGVMSWYISRSIICLRIISLILSFIFVSFKSNELPIVQFSLPAIGCDTWIFHLILLENWKRTGLSEVESIRSQNLER